MTKTITKEARRHALRDWTRADSIRSAKAARTREAMTHEARFFTMQDDRETESVLHGARVLTDLPLASRMGCPLPRNTDTLNWRHPLFTLVSAEAI